jgi:hypothetical protein
MPISFHRVTELPAAPVPGAIYFVKSAGVVRQYVVDATGALEPVQADAVGSETYEHVQSSAAATWTINHNLGFKPAISLRTVGGVEFEAEITHVSDNQAVVSLVTAMAGYARCA